MIFFYFIIGTRKSTGNSIHDDTIDQSVLNYSNRDQHEDGYNLDGGREENRTFFLADSKKYIDNQMNNLPNGQRNCTCRNINGDEGSVKDGKMHEHDVSYNGDDSRKYFGKKINRESNQDYLTWFNKIWTQNSPPKPAILPEGKLTKFLNDRLRRNNKTNIHL